MRLLEARVSVRPPLSMIPTKKLKSRKSKVELNGFGLSNKIELRS